MQLTSPNALRRSLIVVTASAVWWAFAAGCRQGPAELVSGSGNVIVTAPTANRVVCSPVTVRGHARVFEAALIGRVITMRGDVLGETYFTADAGGPQFGDFYAEVPFKMSASRETGYVEVFARSPKDGAVIDRVSIPVRLRHR